MEKRIVHYDTTKYPQFIYHLGINTTVALTHAHLTKVFGDITLIDRTESLPSPINVKIKYPLPEYKTVSNIDDIGLQRACDLIDYANANNKTIRVMWSGGLDSTCALIWLLNCGKDINKFEVALNQYSIDEYPAFFYSVLQKLPIKIVNTGRYVLDIEDDVMLVTGEHGDQLFGNTVMKRFRSDVKLFGYDKYYYEHNINAMTLPMYPLFEMLFVEASLDVNGGPRIKEYLKPLIDRAPFKLKTLFDLTWWINFTMKWQEVGYRMTSTCPKKHDNHFGFFSSNEFQQWSMDEKNHIENKIDWNSVDPWNSTYKKALRNVILHYTGDTHYYSTKPKVDSLMHHNLNGMFLRYEDGTYDTFKDVILNIEDYKNIIVV